MTTQQERNPSDYSPDHLGTTKGEFEFEVIAWALHGEDSETIAEAYRVDPGVIERIYKGDASPELIEIALDRLYEYLDCFITEAGYKDFESCISERHGPVPLTQTEIEEMRKGVNETLNRRAIRTLFAAGFTVEAITHELLSYCFRMEDTSYQVRTQTVRDALAGMPTPEGRVELDDVLTRHWQIAVCFYRMEQESVERVRRGEPIESIAFDYFGDDLSEPAIKEVEETLAVYADSTTIKHFFPELWPHFITE